MKSYRLKLFGFIIFGFISSLFGQGKKELQYSVSYVAASVVYINAGREGSIAVGDTLTIYHEQVQIGTVLVTAVSKKSSASQILSQSFPIVAGDEARIVKIVEIPQTEIVLVKKSETDSTSKIVSTPMRVLQTGNDENEVTGRIGLQYSGVLAEDSRLNLNQPSVMGRINIRNLYGTGMVFSMYGRTYYDLSDIYSRYGDHSRLKNRMYDFSLQTNDPEASLGYGVGRMSSEFVGGLGTFDGGHFYYRYNTITSGFLFGARVQEQKVSVEPNEIKGAFFVNVKFGSDFLHQYNGTLAYGRQLVKGNLDREFLYLQNFLTMGSEISLYESTEIELNDINNGVKKKALKLSNTYFSVNYYPNEWLSTNVGFDGSRTIYLFETMKSISDTLLDKNLMQGYRFGATVKLPYYMSLSGNISYRTKKGDARDARTISTTYRISDILRTDIGAGVRYADIVGVYSNGTNFTLDLDRTFFYVLSVALRYDYYKYTILTLKQTYTTHTATINTSYRFSRMLYSSLAVDGVLDNTMNSMRVYAEIGIRF